MGEITRNIDWSKHSLGMPDQWPYSLRTSFGILLHSAFPMLLFWGDELICFYNDAFRPSLGTDGKHPAQGQRGRLMWAEIWDFIGPSIDQVITTGEVVSFEDQRLPFDRNGHVENSCWTFSYSPAYGDEGQISGVFVTCTETTRTVMGRNQSQKSLQRALSFLEQSPVAIANVTMPDFVFRQANPFFGELVDRSPDELIGKPLFEALPELVGQGFEPLLQRVMETGVPYIAPEVPVDLIRNGRLETIYVDLTYQPQREADGIISGILIVCTDVTQQVRSRKAVETSESRLRSLVESAPFPIGVYVGPQMVIQLANQSIIDVWGKGPEVIGKTYAEVLPELADQQIYDQLAGVYTTGIPFHVRYQRVDLVVEGKLQPFYFNYSFTPLFDSEGKVYGVMNTAAEVTDFVVARQELEVSEARYRQLAAELEQLVQERTEELASANEELAAANEELAATNEELAANNEELETTNDDLAESNQLLTRSNLNLEQFAYVASHDLQEPLRKVQQFGDLLREQFKDQLGDGLDYVDRMQHATGRMSALIRDLLTFSRISTQRERFAPVALDQVVKAALSDLEMVIGETGAKVSIESLPPIEGDALQLGQLFQNLLSNALKFRRPGITSEIRIQYNYLPAAKLPNLVKPSRMADYYHQIGVSDNGIGFEPKYTDRIFKVFQRLHGRNEYAGTGIGLAICEKVVANHGGAINATSQPGQGSTFRIYLPA